MSENPSLLVEHVHAVYYRSTRGGWYNLSIRGGDLTLMSYTEIYSVHRNLHPYVVLINY
jgi:hypothetical protein